MVKLNNEAKCDKFTAINELAKRRGFFWQSYEIYGGVGGFITYGPLGAKLKQNIEAKLRELFVTKLGLFEIESSIITPGKVFEASGHVNHFKEPMVECIECNKRFRADHLLEEYAKQSCVETEKMNLTQIQEALEAHGIKCPECGGGFKPPQQFLTMFKTTIGPYSNTTGYGRPEAAQGIFVEFNRLYAMARERLPFGVIQIGHALRNEISPRQGLIRLREFTIADLEFFFDPEEPNCCLLKNLENETLRIYLARERQACSEKIVEVTAKAAINKQIIRSEWQAFFMVMAKKLLVEIGVPAENQRFIEKLPWEKAHYATQCFDQEVYVDRWGWIEVSGHAYRTDYDLDCHIKASGADLRVYKEYPKPMEQKQLVVKPIKATLGPAFKADAAKVVTLLANASADAIATSLEKNGYYMAENYRVLPEHVDISYETIILRGKRFIPHVIEPSFGSDRLFYVALEYAYRVKDDRVLMSFPRDIAPTQLGVYPLVSKDGIAEKARKVHQQFLDEGFTAELDETGSIGRRYARADEAGVPLGITVDYETLREDTVTIRNRDSWQQVRSLIKDLPELLHKYFQGKINFEDLGTLLSV
ncbi:glycine--tRNA ligase [Candidatus Bathyarchaeota archaeon]|nr:glycine--tRNA ligase [Candidatus Bathyarchaeota archaeon]